MHALYSDLLAWVGGRIAALVRPRVYAPVGRHARSGAELCSYSSVKMPVPAVRVGSMYCIKIIV